MLAACFPVAVPDSSVEQGKPYYYNTKTMQTSWSKPPEMSAAPTWKAAQEPGTGRTYWYNADTKETTWDRPAGAPGPEPQGGMNQFGGGMPQQVVEPFAVCFA